MVIVYRRSLVFRATSRFALRELGGVLMAWLRGEGRLAGLLVAWWEVISDRVLTG